MVELLGQYKVSTDFIRSLTIDCLALDISAYNLFVDGTHSDGSIRTKQIYEEKLSTSLLSLAVTVRVLRYQGIQSKAECPVISYCGFYESENDNDRATVSIKDICDKIIHADSIKRSFEKLSASDPNPITFIKGKHKKKKWELSISVSLFCESVLNWLDEIDKV